MDGGPRTAIRGTRGTFETRAGLGMAKEQSPIDPEDPAAHGDELPGSREPPRTLQKGEDKLWVPTRSFEPHSAIAIGRSYR